MMKYSQNKMFGTDSRTDSDTPWGVSRLSIRYNQWCGATKVPFRNCPPLSIKFAETFDAYSFEGRTQNRTLTGHETNRVLMSGQTTMSGVKLLSAKSQNRLLITGARNGEFYVQVGQFTKRNLV